MNSLLGVFKKNREQDPKKFEGCFEMMGIPARIQVIGNHLSLTPTIFVPPIFDRVPLVFRHDGAVIRERILLRHGEPVKEVEELHAMKNGDVELRFRFNPWTDFTDGYWFGQPFGFGKGFVTLERRPCDDEHLRRTTVKPPVF
jgi:hypothetical protein